ncbi:MAG: universal stress protein [Pseudomonadota bacterium]|uniref:universal stress protein n=1 Tax=Sulfuricystis thermophila TaxID=2496847 RepID=UPI001035EE6D|nr:universal stress protein [Sulfuricystis thermophila]
MTAENFKPFSGAENCIVVATDLSDGARIAVERGALLAKQLGAELVLLHVFNDGLWATITQLYDAERWHGQEPVLATRERLSGLATDLTTRHGIDVVAETRTGRAAASIASFVVERHARLLVVGEHGENWVGDTFVGGTALKVLKRAGVPALLARRPASAGYRRILIATDFSDCARRAALLARELFPTAERALLHVYSVAFEGRMRLAGAGDADVEHYRDVERRRAEAQLREFAAAIDGVEGWRTWAVYGSPAPTICTQAMQHDADLIVIGRHGGSEAEEWLLGSVTQNVLYNAPCDVLLSP